MATDSVRLEDLTGGNEDGVVGVSDDVEVRSPGTAPRLQVGRVLGDCYEVERCLGRGGMGEVYLAHDRVLDRMVAIKTLHPLLTRRLEENARARREGRLLSRLDHPHVVKIYYFGATEELCFLVMEFMNGGDLARYVRVHGSLSSADAYHVIRQVAAALSHAHGHGVVHRDVKPANVLLGRVAGDPMFAKVADFGLARSLNPTDASAHSAVPQAVVGTPKYMAPEQIRGGHVDQRSDIYSLGMLAYELLAARHPFAPADHAALFDAHLHQEVPPLSSLVPEKGFGHQTDHVLATALAKDPSTRFHGAEDFARELGDALRLDGVPGCGSVLRGEAARATLPSVPEPMTRVSQEFRTAGTETTATRQTQRTWGGGAVVMGALELRSAISERPLYQGEMSELMEEAARRLDCVVQERGGRMLHLVDGRWLALFGIGQDAAEHALDAALAMRTSLLALKQDPTLDYQVRVAVRVAADCGRIAFPRRFDAVPLVVDGEPVSRTRELLAGAELGEVRVTERLLQRAASLYETTPTGDESVYLLHQRASGSAIGWKLMMGSETPFIGRRIELELLNRALVTAVEEERLAVATVYGAGGMGKSRLIGEFSRRVAAQDLIIDTAWCSPTRVGFPYEPFSEILQARMAPWTKRGEEPVQALASMMLAVGWQDRDAAMRHARRVALLLGMEASSPHQPWESDVHPSEKLAAYGALADLLACMARNRPLVLHIDDYHWARSATVELLQHLVERLRDEPVLLILGMQRSHLVAIEALKVPLDCQTPVRLTALALGETSELLRLTLPEAFPAAAEVERAIYDVTGGVPLHLAELVATLRERRDLLSSSERMVNELDIDAIALERAAEMKVEERTLLDRHVVAGTTAWRSLLVEGLDSSEDHWARLLESGLVVGDRNSLIPGERQTSFKHQKLRDALYRNLGPGWRRDEHRRIAIWLSHRCEAVSETLEEVAAYHFEKANERLLAGEMYQRAAHRAMRVYASTDAIQLFERAITNFEKAGPGQHAVFKLRDAHLGGARAAGWAGDLRRGLSLLDVAEQESSTGAAGSPSFRAQLRVRRAELQEQLGDFSEALKNLAEAESLLAVSDAPALTQLVAMARHAAILARRGHLEQAAAIARRGLELSSAGPPNCAAATTENRREWHRAVGGLHAALGHTLCRRKLFDEGERAYELSHRHWRATEHPFGEATAVMHLGIVAYWKGDLGRARSRLQESTGIFEQSGSTHGLSAALTNLAEIELALREPEQALLHLRAAEQILRPLGTDDVLPETLRLKAEAFQVLGDDHAAMEAVEESIECAERAGHDYIRGNALLTLARCHEAAGRRNEAVAALARARECFPNPGQCVRVDAMLAELTGPVIGDPNQRDS